MERVYNFGAGPATLPFSVLLQAQSELLDWQQQGMSVMEISHRSKQFMALLEETTTLARELLAVPNDYHILWLGAPARYHFSAITNNFLKNQADYVVTGSWSKMAFDDGQRIGNARLAATNENSNFLDLPSEFNFDEQADYCYITPNETLTGLKLDPLPGRPSDVPLIADMTSCIFSEKLEINDYAMIIAGAQKNLAPSGLSLVIVHNEFLQQAKVDGLGSFINYHVHAKSQSNYATPPTFNIYMANLMLKWLVEQGGVEAISVVNNKKASMLYDEIDTNPFYQCPIKPELRSNMNVAFTLSDDTLTQQFIEQAKTQGLVALKGHRSLGGLRASIYNAMSIEGVEKLVGFMKYFSS